MKSRAEAGLRLPADGCTGRVGGGNGLVGAVQHRRTLSSFILSSLEKKVRLEKTPAKAGHDVEK